MYRKGSASQAKEARATSSIHLSFQQGERPEGKMACSNNGICKYQEALSLRQSKA